MRHVPEPAALEFEPFTKPVRKVTQRKALPNGISSADSADIAAFNDRML
jgi:hypothetical protein